MVTRASVDLFIYAILLVTIDSLYLSFISNPFGAMIEKIQGSNMVVKILPAIVVYMVLVASWKVFVYPELKKRSPKDTIVRAGMLGFFIYSVFDFTNLAVIKDYKLGLAVIDSLWGGILFSITSALFIFIRKLI